MTLCFHRRYSSKLAPSSRGLQVHTRYDAERGAIALEFSNQGTTPLECRVTLADICAVDRGESRVRNHQLKAGASISECGP